MIAGVLADTQAVVLWLSDEPSLPTEARRLIGDSGLPIYVSAASVWEAAIKTARGKLDPPEDLPVALEREGFDLLPVEAEDAWAVLSLPDHHRDPFDRLIIAQAMRRGLPVLTGDRHFARYGVDVLW